MKDMAGNMNVIKIMSMIFIFIALSYKEFYL